MDHGTKALKSGLTDRYMLSTINDINGKREHVALDNPKAGNNDELNLFASRSAMTLDTILSSEPLEVVETLAWQNVQAAL